MLRSWRLGRLDTHYYKLGGRDGLGLLDASLSFEDPCQIRGWMERHRHVPEQPTA